MLKENDLKPEECIYFDDQEKNLKAAESIGIKSFMFMDEVAVEKIVREYMTLDTIILISDPEVLKLPIQDNGDPLVDLRTLLDMKIGNHKADASDSYFKVRKFIAEKLIEADEHLPEGLAFLIVEGYRPLSLQKKYFDGYSQELRQAHSNWDEKKIYAEASKYVAPPDINPPHSTGGAIDLTLAKDGVELDMGTRINADPEESKNACFTLAENISDGAKANRKILIDVMASVGFVNYPTEWWHWSYGDRYWAYQSKQPNAIYNSI